MKICKTAGALLLAVCMLFALVPVQAEETPPAAQAAFYVDPASGSDGNDGSEAKPFQTIQRARDAVREINGDMTGDITVYLRGGLYPLTEPVQFNEADSGSNGFHVVYRAYPGEEPVISGGVPVTGWTLYDEAKNIYRATMEDPVKTRSLFVNGVRAARARDNGTLPGVFSPIKENNKNVGFSVLESDMANWKNIEDVEAVYQSGFVTTRCTVHSRTQNGAAVELLMKQPAWENQQGRVGEKAPDYIENAYELLDEEGEWYLDNTGAIDEKNGPGTFYYKPRAGEDMSTAEVVAPVLEELFVIKGSSLDNPVKNMQFYGLTFAHTTYMRPSTNLGFNGNQSNILSKIEGAPFQSTTTPAQMHMETVLDSLVERCNFTKAGAAGLNIVFGSQDNLVQGCTFIDIAGSGLQVGRVYEEMGTDDNEDNNPIDPRAWLRNNDVLNNYFDTIGVDFISAVGIFAAHPIDMDISYNEICNTTYSGITTGWNWGNADSADRNTHITHNYLHDTMLKGEDGGAYYHLGTSYDLYITDNHFVNQVHPYGAVYLDNGTSNATVENNVFEQVPGTAFVNTGAYNNTVGRNYSDSNGLTDVGWYNTLEDLVIIKDGNWPQEAVEIMENAGIQPAYQDIIPKAEGTGEAEEEPLPEPLSVEFEGKRAWVTGISNLTNLRNNYLSPMGCRLTTGSSPITVTALGRVCLPEDTEIHDLRIMAADRTTVVAEAHLDVLKAPANGDIKYVQLEQPVTLEPNTDYYLVSDEGLKDKWFDSGLKVTTTDAAVMQGSVFRNDLSGGGTGGSTFIGLDFLYVDPSSSAHEPVTMGMLRRVQRKITPEPAFFEADAPVDTEGTSTFVSRIRPGTVRNDWKGWAGMKITIGDTPIAVTALGRLAVGESTETHRLRIFDATRNNAFTELTSTVVDMNGVRDKQFHYAALPQPVVLEAGKSYYIMSEENYGKDYWYDGNMTIEYDNAVATVDGTVFKNEQMTASNGAPYMVDAYGTGNSLVGLDFRYTTDLSVADRQNLVYNGDFEDGVGGYMCYTAKVLPETLYTLNGSEGSMRVNARSATGYVTRAATLQPGKTYEISAWFRMEQGSASALFRMSHPSGANPSKTYVMPADNKVGTEWKQVKGICKIVGTNPMDDALIELCMVSPSGVSTPFVYYVDNFTIREIEDTISNGDFESQPSMYTSAVPMWNRTGCNLTHLADKALTYNGSNGSAKVEQTTEGGYVSQPFQFKAGYTYQLSTWVRTDGDSNSAQFVIENTNGTVNLAESAISVNGEWKQLTATYQPTEADVAGLSEVSVQLTGQGMTTYYFDDFTVIPDLPAKWAEDAALTAASASAEAITISWPACEGTASEYVIYIDGLEAARVPGDVTSYTAEGLSADRAYEFMVAAADEQGTETYYGNPVQTIVTVDTKAPQFPSYAYIDINDAAGYPLSIYWNMASDVSGIESYIIYANGQELLTVEGTKTEAELKDLTAGQTYEFTIRAKDKAGHLSEAALSYTAVKK